MTNSEARFLVFYSSPTDAPRLRLGREEQLVDDVLRELHLESSIIQRVHATSVEDFTRALQDREFEVVQFSGHGHDEGILLEDRREGKSVSVPAGQIAKILRETSPALKAAIFMSCYSAESIPELAEAAPFIITVTGAAVDEAAIEYMPQFYGAYLRTGSVEHAFNMAGNFLGLGDRKQGLNASLNRRAIIKGVDRVLFQVFPSGKDDSILLDLTEAEPDISALNISRDDFLGLLSRKIRIHRWIFSNSRQKVVLSLGPYFGLFSWQDANDVVIFHKILKVRSNVSEQMCEAWASLIVSYNDHFMDPYRTAQEPNDPRLAHILPRTLEEYSKTYKDFFDTGEKGQFLREADPYQFKISKAGFSSSLNMAENKLHQEQYAMVAKHLEAALSAIHDLLDRLSVVLTSDQ